MARDELFLFATTIFQKYDVMRAEEEKFEPIKPIFGFGMKHSEFHVVFKKREGLK